MMRHIRHLGKIGTMVVALAALPALRAAPYGPDPVEDFRQALKTPVRDPMNQEEIRFRRAQLEKRMKALTIGDLRRALALQEWRDQDPDENVIGVDRPIREALVKRLSETLRRVLERGTTAG